VATSSASSTIEDNSDKVIETLSSKFSTTSTNTDDSLSMVTAAMSPPKRRNSITENPSIRHANMSNALTHLATHIQSLKADKMASTMTRFFSMAGKGAGSSRLAETYLVPINAPEVKSKEEKSDINEVPITSLMLLISEDMREALGETIFEHFGSDKNRLTIEEFVNVRRKFGFLPPNASANSGTVNALLNSNVGELLLIKLIDRDNDGYISAEDIYTFQVLINQKNESILSTVFRIYTEALWYPGRNVNYLNTVQRINFKGSNSSVAATISQHLSTIPSMLGRGNSFVGESPQISPPPEHGISPPGKSDGIAAMGNRPPSKSMDDKYDVVEPPKFITAKNVSAVFEKFGYNPKHAETVFNVLCETLQRIRLARPSNRPASLTELQQQELQEQQEQQSAENRDSTASKDSDDDDEEELKKASENSIWKRFTLRSGSTTTSETGGVESDSVKNVKRHRMDVNDFIRACRIDDVLIQVLFYQQQRRLYAIIERAEKQVQQETERQKKLPLNQRVDIKLSTFLREELKQSFQGNDK
jgi:hypothetical protein